MYELENVRNIMQELFRMMSNGVVNNTSFFADSCPRRREPTSKTKNKRKSDEPLKLSS